MKYFSFSVANIFFYLSCLKKRHFRCCIVGVYIFSFKLAFVLMKDNYIIYCLQIQIKSNGSCQLHLFRMVLLIDIHCQ